MGSDRQERVSSWEIDPSVSLPPLSIQSSPRLKKLRTSLQATPPSNPVTGISLSIEIPKGDLFIIFFNSRIFNNIYIFLQQEGVGFWTLRSQSDPLRSCKVKKI